MTQTMNSEKSMKHYAVGTYERLAEERYGEPRRADVAEYENGPSVDELIAELVEKGLSLEVAKNSVQKLADEMDFGLFDRLVECGSCGKMAAVGAPVSGGVRVVCGDCETDMRAFTREEDDE